MAGYIGNSPTPVPLTSADLADSIITSAKIADGTIVGADINSTFDLTGKTVTGAGGITEADQWRLTATLTGSNDVISANLERVDSAGQGTLGTGMSESSGIFSFPSTGIWLVIYNADINFGTTENVGTSIYTTTDNSTYGEASTTYSSASAGYLESASCCFIFDVTSTANCKVKFYTSCGNSGTQTLMGNTNNNQTHITWIKLGET
jgi:hypothetical protein